MDRPMLRNALVPASSKRIVAPNPGAMLIRGAHEVLV
jgi:hypothetical protein